MQVKFSSVFSLFCLIGCLYQIYDITKFYLQFKVRRDVAYDYSASIELPAIDIMVPMGIALNYTRFIAFYPEMMQLLCARLKERFKKLNYKIDYSRGRCDDAIVLKILESDPVAYSFNNTAGLRVRDIHLASIDLEHQFKEILVTSFAINFALNHKNCTTTRYYNGLAIFMRIYCRNGTKPFFIEKNTASRNLGYTHILRHSFGLYFGIRLSDPADLPIFELSKYFIITRKPGLFPQVVISFVKIVMSSLEYPYETNCRHYNKHKFISTCMTEYTLGQLPPYLFRNSVQKSGEHPFHLGFRKDNSDNKISFSKKVSQGELDAFINCNQQAAATQCEKTDYLLEGKVFNDKDSPDYGLIWFKPSWQANVYLSVHPVLPWNEYFIFIGSIVGLWFGISMYDNAFKIFSIIKTRFLSLKNKQNNEKKGNVLRLHKVVKENVKMSE